MNNYAYFFRNLNDVVELNERTMLALREGHRQSKYSIIERVKLTNEEFTSFTKNFRTTQNFIIPFRYRLDINPNYEYGCIAIGSDNSDFEVLVCSWGHSYARTIAVIPKK